jgi:hypothetical protein
VLKEFKVQQRSLGFVRGVFPCYRHLRCVRGVWGLSEECFVLEDIKMCQRSLGFVRGAFLCYRNLRCVRGICGLSEECFRVIGN